MSSKGPNMTGSGSDPKGFDDFELRLGDLMRGERATLGKSLLDVQRELKIKANYIAAIENSDPSAFETQGFIAGYVRSYARYLGLDAEWAYETFCAEGNFQTAHGMSEEASGLRRPETRNTATVTGPRDPFTQPSVSFVPKTQRSFTGIDARAFGSIAVLLILIGGIGYGGWSVLQEVQKVRFTPVDQSPSVVADVESFTNGPTELTAAQNGADETGPSVEAFDRLYRPEALDVPVLVARDGPIARLDPSQVGTFAPASTDALTAARQAPAPLAPEAMYPGVYGQEAEADVLASAPETVQAPSSGVQVVEDATPEVVLFAVRPSWVRVRGGNGSVIFEKILDAGEEYAVPLTETPPTLRAGNAQSVFFRVNGVTLGPAGATASVVSDVPMGPAELQASYEEADLSQDEALSRYVDLSGGAAQ